MTYDLDAISLGAGVQSSAMYLQAVAGELEAEGDLVAIWADVQAEPPWVYEQLDYLERVGGHVIPIHRVTAGSLERNLYSGGEGRKGFAQIPAFIDGEHGRGMGRRQCTFQYKIRPIERACRDLLGLEPGQHAAGKYRVRQWIGISTDEAHRAKPSSVPWVERHYPLLFERPQRRGDLLRWMTDHGHPEPRASSCYFCPFHSDRDWILLRDDAPEQFAQAVQIDRDLRTGDREAVYLHSSLKPLDEVGFEHENQPDLWGNECEGACGV